MKPPNCPACSTAGTYVSTGQYQCRSCGVRFKLHKPANFAPARAHGRHLFAANDPGDVSPLLDPQRAERLAAANDRRALDLQIAAEIRADWRPR